MREVNDHFLKESLVGEEWMALRQIALGGKAAAIPQSVRLRLVDLGLVARDPYGRLRLTETGRRMIETPRSRGLAQSVKWFSEKIMLKQLHEAR